MKTLASNCLFVKGYKKNLLIDLQNNNWYQIEQSEFELTSESLDKEMKDYLIEHGILLDIPTRFLKNFTPYSTNYESFAHIESIIMDIDSSTNYDVIQSIRKMEDCNL